MITKWGASQRLWPSLSPMLAFMFGRGAVLGAWSRIAKGTAAYQHTDETRFEPHVLLQRHRPLSLKGTIPHSCAHKKPEHCNWGKTYLFNLSPTLLVIREGALLARNRAWLQEPKIGSKGTNRSHFLTAFSSQHIPDKHHVAGGLGRFSAGSYSFKADGLRNFKELNNWFYAYPIDFMHISYPSWQKTGHPLEKRNSTAC